MNNDTETINGLIVKIDYDDMAENPTEWETADERTGHVHFVLEQKNYNLPFEADVDLSDFEGWQGVADAVVPKGWTVKFVRWYEHSGISVSLRDDSNIHEWDAGCIGFVYGETIEDVKRYFEPFAAYMSGEVYSFTVTNPKDGEIVDSCSGYYSYDEVTEAARLAATEYEWPNQAAYAKSARELHR